MAFVSGDVVVDRRSLLVLLRWGAAAFSTLRLVTGGRVSSPVVATVILSAVVSSAQGAPVSDESVAPVTVISATVVTVAGRAGPSIARAP